MNSKDPMWPNVDRQGAKKERCTWEQKTKKSFMEEVCLEHDLQGRSLGGRGGGRQDLEKQMKTGRTLEFMESQVRPSKNHEHPFRQRRNTDSQPSSQMAACPSRFSRPRPRIIRGPRRPQRKWQHDSAPGALAAYTTLLPKPLGS